jgi:hypothetical protein
MPQSSVSAKVVSRGSIRYGTVRYYTAIDSYETSEMKDVPTHLDTQFEIVIH